MILHEQKDYWLNKVISFPNVKHNDNYYNYRKDSAQTLGKQFDSWVLRTSKADTIIFFKFWWGVWGTQLLSNLLKVRRLTRNNATPEHVSLLVNSSRSHLHFPNCSPWASCPRSPLIPHFPQSPYPIHWHVVSVYPWKCQCGHLSHLYYPHPSPAHLSSKYNGNPNSPFKNYASPHCHIFLTVFYAPKLTYFENTNVTVPLFQSFTVCFKDNHIKFLPWPLRPA